MVLSYRLRTLTLTACLGVFGLGGNGNEIRQRVLLCMGMPETSTRLLTERPLTWFTVALATAPAIRMMPLMVWCPSWWPLVSTGGFWWSGLGAGPCVVRTWGLGLCGDGLCG